MINCIIVEDEFPAREELKFLMKKYDFINIISEFDNSVEALKYIHSVENIDVIFLDINMPNLDGINLGKIIYNYDKNIKLIFITAYKEYAVEAFEIEAFDYLLKPYSEKRMDKTIENLRIEVNNNKNQEMNLKKIVGYRDEKIYVLDFEDIYFIEVREKETLIHTKNNFYLSKFRISALEELLKEKSFFRTHRSYIVNLDCIDEIEQWFGGTYLLKIKDKDFSIPVSRNKMKEFRELFLIK